MNLVPGHVDARCIQPVAQEVDFKDTELARRQAQLKVGGLQVAQHHLQPACMLVHRHSTDDGVIQVDAGTKDSRQRRLPELLEDSQGGCNTEGKAHGLVQAFPGVHGQHGRRLMGSQVAAGTLGPIPGY